MANSPDEFSFIHRLSHDDFDDDTDGLMAAALLVHDHDHNED
jgi:hypothetical protein